MNAIETEGVMTLISNAEVKTALTIPSTKNVTLDLAGYELTMSQGVTNNGTFKVTDSSENVSGIFNMNTSGTGILSTNNLILDKGKLISTINNDYLISATSGTLEVKEMVISSAKGSIVAKEGVSKLVINGGELTSKSDNAIFTSAYTEVNGGKINAENGSGIFAYYGSELKITGGEVKATGAGLSIYTKVTVSGGYIYGKTDGINSMGTVVITGGKIEGTTGIYSNSSVTMSGGDVYGTTYGAVSRVGNFVITNGKIEGGTYGIYNINSGVTTIGTQDETVKVDSPIIKGNTYGVYRENGTVNFYDGILKGQTAGYYPVINTVQDGTTIISGTEIIEEVVYQTNYLTPQTEIVQIGTTKYKNIQTAIDEANNGDTITMIDNATIYYPLIISSDENITLDLAGYNLSTTKTITNNGTFTITDSVSNGVLTELAAVKMITNNSVLNINNVAFNNNATTNDLITNNTDSSLILEDATIDSLSGIYSKGTTSLNDSNINIKNDNVIESYGPLTIDGGKYITTNSYTSVYHSDSLSKLNISNSTLTGYNSIYNLNTIEGKLVNNILNGVVANNNSSAMNINSSTINGSVSNGNSAIMNIGNCTINGIVGNYSTNKMEVNDKTIININNSSYGVYNEVSGIIDLNDVKINSTNNTYDYSAIFNIIGTINVTDVNIELINETNTYSRTIDGIYNKSTGTINLNDISITSSDLVNSKTLRGISNNSTGTVNLNSGNISITGGNQSIGLYSQTANGNINFLSGDVTVTGATTSYGAYINNGNITLGTKDEKVDITTPTIKAVGTTGIGAKKVNGYLKFYDGKITGSTSAKPETTTEVEYGYEVHNYTDENGYDYCILEYME